MCGRTACTLEPDDICKACHYRDKNGDKRTPSWRNDLSNGTYFPSYNMGPTKFSPLLISGKHFDEPMEDERILVPVSWGLFPFNARGEWAESQRIINARTETVLEKPTFKIPLLKGKRCVVLADGYYEWHRINEKPKEAYFIHFSQPDGVKINSHTWNSTVDKNETWGGPRLLTMAGIFNVSKENQLGYVVLTVKAAATVSHIHDRMPAILDGEEAVQNWLDYGQVKMEQAVGNLKPSEDLQFYQVSNFVNNIRNNSEECYQPFAPKKTVQATFMQNWLKRAAKTDDISSPPQPDAKKIKKEIV